MFKAIVDSGKEVTPLIFKSLIEKRDLVDKV